MLLLVRHAVEWLLSALTVNGLTSSLLDLAPSYHAHWGPCAGDPWTGEPLGTNALQPVTIALAACLAAVWLAVNSLLAASGTSASPGSLFLGKLLHLWGSASALGLQAFLQRLQVVASGLLLAPPQLQRYRTLVHSVDWAALGWAGGRA
jgi:hypothetical protein